MCSNVGDGNNRLSRGNTTRMATHNKRLCQDMGWQCWVKIFSRRRKNMWWGSTSPHSSSEGPKWLLIVCSQNREVSWLDTGSNR